MQWIVVSTVDTDGMVLKLLAISRHSHQMATFSALLAICAGNSPVPGEFPTQRPVMWSFDVFFDLRLNKWLSKQFWGWWFEMLSCPLWHDRSGCIYTYGFPNIHGLILMILCWKKKISWSVLWLTNHKVVPFNVVLLFDIGNLLQIKNASQLPTRWNEYNLNWCKLLHEKWCNGWTQNIPRIMPKVRALMCSLMVT